MSITVRPAVEMLEHVVEVEKALAEDHPSRLASQHALAGAYRANGQVADAVEMLEHVAEVRKALAEDHPSRMTSQFALREAYVATGKHQKAEELRQAMCLR